jgi:hypothetical protein
LDKEDTKDLSMRTDDVAHRIEFAVKGVWTPEQYKKVVSILRHYRHQSILSILDRAAGDPGDTGKGGPE